VTLFEGPGYAVGAVAGALVGGAGGPAALAGLGGAVFGAVDDLVGSGASRGLRGHLASARRGELTTGAVKVLGLGATGLLAAGMIDQQKGRAAIGTSLVGGAVIAGSANIVNLFDLRPGRALKVVLLLSAPIAASGHWSRGSSDPTIVSARASTTSSAAPAACSSTRSAARESSAGSAIAAAAAGAAIAALPGDLAGRSMLGDTGANSAGALVGAALVARCGPRGRLLALALITALTLASEKVSFTAVIESTPGLRELDAMGRPPWTPQTVDPPGAAVLP